MHPATKIARLVILIGAFTAGSATYADQHMTPAAPDAAPGMMQQEDDMSGAGMEGMMSMMDQMNKMMMLCTKMMEGMMTEMDQGSGPAKAP